MLLCGYMCTHNIYIRALNMEYSVALLFFIIMHLVIGPTYQLFDEQWMVRDLSLDNLWASTSFIDDCNSHSAIECTYNCLRNVNCQSFFYSTTNNLCQLHDTIIDSPSGLDSATHGSKYYKLKTAAQNFTFECPSVVPMTSFETSELSDGSNFTYMINWDLRAVNEAENNCSSAGAQLVEVLTLSKMQALRHIFTSCQGYIGAGDYWVSVSNAASPDFFDIRYWKTKSGNSVPTSTDFWAPEEPRFPDTDHCAAMWATSSYFWFALPCSYSNYYICEKP